MRFFDSVLAEHLPDYKLGITADQILTGGASFFVFLAQMLEKHDEALIFRDIVAPQGSIWARKVLHVPEKTTSGRRRRRHAFFPFDRIDCRDRLRRRNEERGLRS